MADLEKALENLDSEIRAFRSMKDPSTNPNRLLTHLQQISGLVYYLEGERSKYHNMFQKLIQSGIDEGDSVARSENKAHVLQPEMYLLRHKISAAYEVIGAIRSILSWIKSEKHSIV